MSNANSSILVAGSSCTLPVSELDAQIKALLVDVKYIADSDSQVKHVFISSSELYDATFLDNPQCDWLSTDDISLMKNIIAAIGNPPQLLVIPKGWDAIAKRPAGLGFGLHGLTLYHQGRDLPRWLMKCIYSNGFSF